MASVLQRCSFFRRLFLQSALCVMLLLASPLNAADSLNVFVSIAPQQYFVKRICGNLARISVMVQPGANPAIYEPKPKQMAALAKTDVYFATGVPFEDMWLRKISTINPRMVVVHCEEGVARIAMARRLPGAGLDHGQQQTTASEHSRIMDPHIWLSPSLVMLQARNIFHALLAVDPDHRLEYCNNYRKFIRDLVELDIEIDQILQGRGKKFLVFHPAWGYFARSYGLVQIPIELEGKEPGPVQLSAVTRYAREHQLEVIFVQPQFSWQIAAAIAKSIGGRIVFLDPLAADWYNNLKKAALEISAALR
ncbi:MAG: zinc ABC transporter substrate-binding protein [Deltaproteobacteria bacterium]|nr:zinc ABC transporter substrate-binding protein [Deltaproteobacteria bacterium]MBW2070587.1 zinc ABC transporter substrate-binding protein [Deltaproteobacteria bacterium]